MHDNGIETRIKEMRGRGYIVLLIITSLCSFHCSFSFQAPAISLMNFFQTLPGKENEEVIDITGSELKKTTWCDND